MFVRHSASSSFALDSMGQHCPAPLFEEQAFLMLWLSAERAGKGGIDYLFLTGSIKMPSISRSIFRRLIASLASLMSLKGPAITW